MASKDQGDIDARIARIRAANEERERRHREVLADRLEAEKTKSAVNVKSPESGGTKPVESEERFRSPFEANSSTNSSSAPKNSKKPVHERLANSKSNPSREEPARRGRGRLADDDGPPPDPGYSFLADRMRDGSPEEDESRKNKNNRPKREMRRPAGVGGSSTSNSSHRPSSYQEENVSPKHKSRSKIEESVGQRLREIRDDSSSSSSANSKTSHIKPLMPESFMAKARSAGGGGGGSAQARLDRSRHQRDQNGSSHQYVDRYANANANANRKVMGDGKKDMKIKVNFDRSDSQPDADDDWNDDVGKQAKQQQQQQHHHHQPQQQQPQPLPLPQQLQQPLSATTPSFTPLEQQNQWQPMPIGDWDPNQSTMVIGMQKFNLCLSF